MQRLSPENTIYQYPDPDDLDDVARLAWAGDDNDYIPEALRQTLSSNGPDSEAEYNEHLSSLSGQISHQEHEEIGNQEGKIAIGIAHDVVDFDDTNGQMALDERVGDSHDVALESPRAAGRTHRSRQILTHSTSNSRGRRSRRGGIGRGQLGIRRGLRNPVEPEPEFKVLHSQATMAFIAHDYDEAESLTLQALQINPEMYPAHSLLSQIHAARGDIDKAIAAAYGGAHTQPRNIEMWSRIARMVLDRDQEHSAATLRDAVYCYSRIIAIDKFNVEARFQRAALNHELGKLKQVATEYELLSKHLPHDTTVLRHLAQVSIEINEPDRALKPYKAAIDHFQYLEPLAPVSFTWSDVNVLVELYLFCREYEEGLELTKSLSRWLLGRRSDRCWDSFKEDDREWDLDDVPRRVEFASFVPNQFEMKSYGAGLPLDLRIKLGILRLNLSNEHVDEAINHFEWLDPEDGEIGAKIFDYPDLFRDVGRSLLEKNLHEDAIRFYEPLRQVVDHLDHSYSAELARCYTFVGRIEEAEALQISIRDLNDDDDDKDYDGSDSTEVEIEPRKGFIIASGPSAKRPRKKVERVKENLDFLQELFIQRQSLKGAHQAEKMHVKVQWTNVTQRLVQRFMQEKSFLPDLRSHKSTDSTQQARYRHFVRRKPREKVGAIDSNSVMGPDKNPAMNSGAFAGIAFDDWLEILLEYGLSLAHEGNLSQAYQVITFAAQATVFNDKPDSLFLIHVCWFTCALLNNDDETMCSVCRWFMKEHQFVTDAYRLFSALNRLCDGDKGWFNCGPSQKYILRQIKAMDFSLAAETRARTNHPERSAYTSRDTEGNVILPQNLDVSLLMLYGHILYAGRSYAYANNYFLRALAVDPDNPVIKLSLALGYIHHALKRQAENRHQLLMQGFAFLFEYYNCRQQEGGASEQQEAAYNMARAFHLLGLTHIATPYYEHCLALSKEVQDVYCDIVVEDFAQEAAIALQGIWATNGNEEKALNVTEQWLQI